MRNLLRNLLRQLRTCLSCVLVITFAAQLVTAQAVWDPMEEHEPKRLALIIGNKNYQSLPPIESSKFDAEVMMQRAKELKFEVDYYEDVDTLFKFNEEVLPTFRRKISPGDFVLLYFSGHGFTYGTDSFLALTSIPLTISENEVPNYAISVEGFQDLMAGHSPGLIMMAIDACRSFGGFIIKNNKDENLVSKGLGPLQNQHNAVNSFILYATQPGNIAIGISEPGRPSIFTKSLVDYIDKPGQPFRSIFSDVASDVKILTNGQQVPGSHDWSQTDPFLNPTEKDLAQEKESWDTAVQSRILKEVQKFLNRHSISRYSAAARRWIAENSPHDQAPYTRASPAAIDRAWRPTNENRVSVRRLALPFAFERSLEEGQEQTLQQLSRSEIGLIPSGTTLQKINELKAGQEYVEKNFSPVREARLPMIHRNSLAFSLANIDAHKTVVTLKDFGARLEPAMSATIVQRIPSGTPVQVQDIVFTPDETIWVSTIISGQPTPLYFKVEPGVTPEPLELGQSLKEIVAPPRPDSIPDLVNPVPIKEALDELKAQGRKITWVSLATGATNDANEQDIRATRIANAEYILKGAGIEGRRITSVTGREDVSGNGVRIRFFGFQTEKENKK